jgi:hypothetical protein
MFQTYDPIQPKNGESLRLAQRSRDNNFNDFNRNNFGFSVETPTRLRAKQTSVNEFALVRHSTAERRVGGFKRQKQQRPDVFRDRVRGTAGPKTVAL